MNNKPAAWIDKNTGKPRMEGFIQTDHDIPLYTHPVKELTDEEIKDLYISMKALDQSNILIRFSRELLRKAQEK